MSHRETSSSATSRPFHDDFRLSKRRVPALALQATRSPARSGSAASAPRNPDTAAWNPARPSPPAFPRAHLLRDHTQSTHRRNGGHIPLLNVDNSVFPSGRPLAQLGRAAPSPRRIIRNGRITIHARSATLPSPARLPFATCQTPHRHRTDTAHTPLRELRHTFPQDSPHVALPQRSHRRQPVRILSPSASPAAVCACPQPAPTPRTLPKPLP